MTALVVLGGCGRLNFAVVGEPLVDAPIGTPVDAMLHWSAPQLLPGVSGIGLEWAPALSPDNQLLVFGGNGPNGLDDLFATTLSGTTWSAPTRITQFATPSGETDPAWNAAGTRLYFSSDRNGSPQLFVSSYNGAFGMPTLVPGVETEAIIGPTISADELEMFYTSGVPNHVRVATRASLVDPWQVIGPVMELASTARDGWPTLSPDALTIYFESTRGGNAGIYVATRSARGAPFDAPVLAPTFNDGISNTSDPDLSTDGKTMLFASNRAGGPGGYDIYFSTLSN